MQKNRRMLKTLALLAAILFACASCPLCPILAGLLLIAIVLAVTAVHSRQRPATTCEPPRRNDQSARRVEDYRPEPFTAYHARDQDAVPTLWLKRPQYYD